MKQTIINWLATDAASHIATLAVIVAIITCLIVVATALRHLLEERRSRRRSVPTLYRGSPLLTKLLIVLGPVLAMMLSGCAGIEAPVSEPGAPSLARMPGTMLHVIADAPPWVLWVLLIAGTLTWVITLQLADAKGQERTLKEVQRKLDREARS